jgi:hypothetical protein
MVARYQFLTAVFRYFYSSQKCIWYMIRPVHLPCKVEFGTVITVLTVITPYSMVRVTVGQNFQLGTKYCVRLRVSMQVTAGPFPRAGAAPTQPQGRQGSISVGQYVRGACWRCKWEVLGWRGLSKAIFAQAVPAWHRTVHRTENYRITVN